MEEKLINENGKNCLRVMNFKLQTGSCQKNKQLRRRKPLLLNSTVWIQILLSTGIKVKDKFN